MSDFMLSQVMGMLARVADDIAKSEETTKSHLDTLLGAIDDLSAHMFATQALLCLVLKDNPVKAADAKAWINRQIRDGGRAPKALDMVDFLVERA